MSKKKQRQGLLAIQLSFRTKLIVLMAVAVAVILGVTIFVLALINNNSSSSDVSLQNMSPADRRAANVATAKREGDVNDQAKKALDSGDKDKANEIYQDAIDAEPNTTNKIRLIINQSQLLYAAGKNSEAITVAKTAEGLSDDKYLVADWLSRIYEDQHQYSDAATYYTLAGKSASSPNNISKLNQSYYDQQAARVKARAGADR